MAEKNRDIKYIKQLFEIIEDMDFTCPGGPLKNAVIYLAIKRLLEERFGEPIPEKIIKKYQLNSKRIRSHDTEDLEDTELIKKYIKEDESFAGLLGSYEVTTDITVTAENQNDPGIIIQQCAKGYKKYDRKEFLRMIADMTIEEFNAFAVHTIALQLFAYHNSGRWASLIKPANAENFSQLKYPVGAAFKKKVLSCSCNPYRRR